MDYKQIAADMMSGDVQRIRTASCAIIYAGQNRDELRPLLSSIEDMRAAIKNLDMGGAFAPNKRFPEYAIKTLEFHRDSNECTCKLYVSGYDSFDPDQELKANHIEMVSKSNDDYRLIVRCKKCHDLYDIEIQHGHWIFYEWRRKVM